MMKNAFRSVTTIALALCATSAFASNAKSDAARAYLEQVRIQAGAPGASACVSIGGKVVFSEGVGVADLDSGVPQNGRTIHNIGSVSKPLTAVAVMRLVERGKVKLTDEVQTYLPWFPRKEAPISVWNILTHTSGIRHYKKGEIGVTPTRIQHFDNFEAATRPWRDDPLLFKPGTSSSYSSYATNLLQGIVETVSGKSFEDFLTEEVWKPAGMADTSLDVPSRIVARRGRGYVRVDGQLQNTPYEDASSFYAGGGMLSTDEDLCRFGHALNAGRLLKKETLREMYRLQLPAGFPGDIPAWGKASQNQGLSFFVRKDSKGRPWIGHSGGARGVATMFLNYFEDDVVVAVNFNAYGGKSDIIEVGEHLGTIFTSPASEPASTVAAWTTTPPTIRPGAKPRILLIHDMEGLAGQDDPYSFLHGHPKYPQGQQFLIADVNAVVDGLFAGGAQSVTIVDGHGSGNPDSDILVAQLDPRAKLLSRPTRFDAYSDLAETGDYDAVVVVGMHAKSGSGGFASHTYTIGVELLLEGHSITETELVGLLYGRAGIPVIFASGDDRLANDLRTMPWLQYVTTKKATSAKTAELYPVAAVHAAMRDKAKLAVTQLSQAKVMSARNPLQVTVRAVPPASMTWLKGMPGLTYDNEAVSFTSDGILAAYRGIRPVVTALSYSFASAERSGFNALPNAKALRVEGMQELYRRWLAAESGEPPTPPKAPAKDKEYHG
ncbi:serine hydrolase, partial [Steroidobacter sp.]|uniref:serine hydrolase n=1 Tax=Steroidobacter sp. TaxID=1978227 RepID=UPI001A5FE4E0